MCTRKVGNLALKRIWKAFIRSKVEYLSFEKTKKYLSAEKEIQDFYAEMEELDNEAKCMAKKMTKEIIVIDTEKIIRLMLNSKSIQKNKRL